MTLNESYTFKSLNIGNHQNIKQFIRQLAAGLLMLTVILIMASHAWAYNAPVGIPDPAGSWGGINPIDAAAPSRPANWPSAQAAGYYYIDPRHSSSTDSGNTYGYPNKPRRTIPSSISAGAYVEIHGSFPSTRISAAGTANAPVWIVGVEGDRPTFDGFGISGSYFFVERITIDTVNGFAFLYPTNRGALRFSTIQGTGAEISVNGSGIGMSGQDASHRNEYILIYGCVVRDLGSWTSNSNADFHAIKPRYFSHYIWILENELYHVQGDSVQTGEASGTDFPRYVYIGRNKMYENKENCVDIKDGEDIIISENTCYGMDNLHGDDGGEGVVIHEDADNVWTLNNIVYDCTIGLICTGGSNIYFIGNLLHSFDGSTDAGSGYGGGVAIHFRATATGVAVNNTIYNADKGIQFTGSSNMQGYNNLIANRSDSSAYDIMTGSPTNTDVDNNLIYGYNGGGARIYWSNTYTSISQFKSGTGECANCPSEANPVFVNASASQFSLNSSTSPAVDKGRAPTAFTTFQQRYGLSIAKDIAGIVRPMNGKWDIGAYEYETGSAPVPTPTPTLAAPTGLELVPTPTP